MSEHIIETEVCAGIPFVPLGGIDKLREEIVRCRDCYYFTDSPAWPDAHDCYYFTDSPAWPDAHECDYINRGVEPDGFCAWGERRADHD